MGNGEQGLCASWGRAGKRLGGARRLRRGWHGAGGEMFLGGEGRAGALRDNGVDREGAEGVGGVNGGGLEDAMALGEAGASAVARGPLGAGTLLLAGEPVWRLDAGAG